MLNLDALADSLSKRGYRLHCTTIMQNPGGRSSYFAVATKPGKPSGDGPRGFGRTPMTAYESLALKDMHKDRADELASAFGRLVHAFGGLRDAL